MVSFAEQVALVTGASRGIGKAVARDLAAHGADLVLAARSASDLEALAAELEKSGRQVCCLPLDVSDPAAIGTAVSGLKEPFDRVDILVNNAGVTRDGLMLRMKDEDWKTVLATNLGGAFYLTRQVLAGMVRRRYGRIVNLTSVVAMTGNPGQANYVASKAALIGLTRSLAREVASRNITVNAVAPGFVETDMTAGLGEKARQKMLEGVPLGRPGEPAEVAAAVRFLASSEAGYITGHVLHVNGGMYM